MVSELRPFAFVLMPFSAKFNDIYQFGIKQACSEKGIVAERVDEQRFSETILERVYRQIENADFIIADMTEQNPNVFYEVGFSHARSKLCVLVTQSVSDIPFDLKQHSHVVYDGTATDLKNKLSEWLDWAKLETQKKKVERLTVSLRAVESNLVKTEYVHTGSFDLVIDIRNQTNQRSPEIEAIYVNTLKDWSATAHGKDCPYEIVDGNRIKRSLITPSIRRLAPGAFSQERLSLSKPFWTKWNGKEQKDTYSSKGTVRIEISTSEGTLLHELPIEVSFDENPF
ncbi:hypothetical protein [Tabrizicola sp.]|uniref:hypothetical protein n=1 Tax=Tabrizicola sp. TaxID=2005166 RepID=UPI00286A9A26|nr:hypothetical protein [Tabrizicola sp.]